MKTITKIIKILILAGIFLNLILFIFFDKQIYAYAPVIYWGIAGIIILSYAVLSIMLDNKIEKNHPDLYGKHSLFGFILPNYAYQDPQFLAELNEEEKALMAQRKKLFYYFFICFVLFGVSAFSVFLK